MLRYDIALGVWAAVWVAVATIVFFQVQAIGEVSESLVTAGRGLDRTADGLAQIESTVEGLPFVGQIRDLDEVQERLREAAVEARATARDARESVTGLAWLLAAITGLVPTLPLLALRLALRGKLRNL